MSEFRRWENDKSNSKKKRGLARRSISLKIIHFWIHCTNIHSDHHYRKFCYRNWQCFPGNNKYLGVSNIRWRSDNLGDSSHQPWRSLQHCAGSVHCSFSRILSVCTETVLYFSQLSVADRRFKRGVEGVKSKLLFGHFSPINFLKIEVIEPRRGLCPWCPLGSTHDSL